MAKNLDHLGIKSIVNNYDLFFIDLWGVVHNGIKLYDNSINVLDNLAAAKKKFVLLTNAPRPNENVVNFLKKMGLKKYFKNVFTSGEAANKYLISEPDKQKFFHIGPPRDFDLFKNIEKNNVFNIEDADYLMNNLCVNEIIEKTRYKAPYKGKVWDVDEFHGNNNGLWVAEVELEYEEEDVNIPSWAGKEVTGEIQYYNAYLSKHPFQK